MKLLKYLFLTFTIISSFGIESSYAQLQNRIKNLPGFDKRKIHFGFYLGVNTMDFRLAHYVNPMNNPALIANPDVADKVKLLYGNKNVRADVNPLSPGFSVGMVTNLKLNDFFDLRCTPGMSLGSRQVVLTVPVDESILSGLEQDEATYLTIPSTYVDIPLGLKFSGKRHNNLRPYIYAGGTFRFDLANKKVSESVLHLKRTGFYLDLAMGLDSYLQFFRLSTEFRVSLGIDNIIDHTIGEDENRVPYYSFAVGAARSDVFSLIFYFE